MKLLRGLAGGLGDAAFASLGTFLAGIVAVRELPGSSLAVYAVLFGVSLFAMLLPRNLRYTPSQIAANLRPETCAPDIAGDALGSLRASALAFLIVTVAGLGLIGTGGIFAALALGLTAAAYTVVSPLQDHVRASLHLVGRHFRAAACSVLLALLIGGATLFALSSPDRALVPLIPFGALVLGNGVSLLVGLAFLHSATRHRLATATPLRDRLRLLASDAVIQGAWSACNYAMLFLLGPLALASLEAARVSASPVFILSSAISSFMVPTLVRSLMMDGVGKKPVSELRRAVAFLAVGGIGYAVVLIAYGPIVQMILDKPFVPALSAGRIGEVIVEASANLVGLLVFALGRSHVSLGTSIAAGVIGLGTTIALASVLGVYALPVGQALGMAVRLVAGWTVVRRTLAARSAAQLAVQPTVPALT